MATIGLIWGGAAPCKSAQLFLFQLNPVPGHPSPYRFRRYHVFNQILNGQLRRGTRDSSSQTAPESQKIGLGSLPAELLDLIFSFLDGVIREERSDGLPPQLGNVKSEVYPLLFVSKRIHLVAKRHLFRFFRYTTHYHSKISDFMVWLHWDPQLASCVREIEIADFVDCKWSPEHGGTLSQYVNGKLRSRCITGGGSDSYWPRHKLELVMLLRTTVNLQNLTLHVAPPTPYGYNSLLSDLFSHLDRPEFAPQSKHLTGPGYLPRLRNLKLKYLGTEWGSRVMLFPFLLPSLRHLELDNVTIIEPMADLWPVSSINIESLIINKCIQGLDHIIGLLRVCKALKNFSYVAWTPGMSLLPPQDPPHPVKLPSADDFAKHQDTLETLKIDIYSSQNVVPGRAARASGNALTRFTVLKHVEIPFVWIFAHYIRGRTYGSMFNDMGLEGICEQFSDCDTSADLFPRSMQTLSINGTAIGFDTHFQKTLAFKVLHDLASRVESHFTNLRSVEFVTFFGADLDDRESMMRLAQAMVDVGVEMRFTLYDGVARYTWVAKEAPGQIEEGVGRRVRFECEGRELVSKRDWEDAWVGVQRKMVRQLR